MVDTANYWESAILGSFVLQPSRFAECVEYLSADDFSDSLHRKLFDAISTLHSRGEPIDVKLLFRELELTGDDLVYVSKVINELPHRTNPTSYIVALLLRRAQQIAERIPEMFAGKVEKSSIENAERDLRNLRERIELASGKAKIEAERLMSQAPVDYHAKGGQSGQIVTFTKEMDDAIGGPLSPGLIVIGARPGNGKTLTMLHMLKRIAQCGFSSAMFSLEMGWDSIGERLYGMVGAYHGDSIDEVHRKSKSWFDATGNVIFAQVPPKPETIIERADRFRQEYGIEVIAIDYLQLVEGDGESMYARATDACKKLKSWASINDVTVIVASQLNRETAKGNPRPQPHHLRDTGQIEQDADAIFMLRMPSKDEGDTAWEEHRDNLLEVYVRKLRNRPASNCKSLAYRLDRNLALSYLGYAEDDQKDHEDDEWGVS